MLFISATKRGKKGTNYKDARIACGHSVSIFLFFYMTYIPFD